MGLEVSDLTVHVDTVRWSDDVVRGVDLTVGRGALTLLVGDSGSGKSMLARAISGALPESASVTSGHIEIDGRVGHVPQDGVTSFDQSRSVDAQLRTLARKQGVAVEPAYEAACYPVDVAELLPSQHSGGQIQRAAVAALFLSGADVMIVDEPTASLDTRLAHCLWLSLRARADTGAAVLVVSHDLMTAIDLGVVDRIAVMRDGAVVADGAAADVMDADPYVQMVRTVTAVD